MEKGSLQRSEDSLNVRFVVTDGAKEVTIAYHGILPDLFREGRASSPSASWAATACWWPMKCWPSTTRTTCRRKSPRRSGDSGQLKHYENGKTAGETSYNQEGK